MPDDAFVTLDDLTEASWKEIESLARQIIKYKIYGESYHRAAIAAFFVWLTHNDSGISVKEKTAKAKKAYTPKGTVH